MKYRTLLRDTENGGRRTGIIQTVVPVSELPRGGPKAISIGAKLLSWTDPDEDGRELLQVRMKINGFWIAVFIDTEDRDVVLSTIGETEQISWHRAKPMLSEKGYDVGSPLTPTRPGS